MLLSMLPYSAFLDILKPHAKSYKKRAIVLREISDSAKLSLEKELKCEHEMVLAEKTHISSLGVQYVCSDAVIKQLCSLINLVPSFPDLLGYVVLCNHLNSYYKRM